MSQTPGHGILPVSHSKNFAYLKSRFHKKKFFSRFWQKKPIFFKNAFPSGLPEVSALAIEECCGWDHVESRMVCLDHKNPLSHTIEYGPFSPQDLARPSNSPRTLAIHASEYLFPEMLNVLHIFKQIPLFSFDDAMISWSQKFASLGPHKDHYDVFLLQVKGRKLWQVQSHSQYQFTESTQTHMRLITDFVADKTWMMEPGDLLYIPAGCAHFGVCQEESLAYSVGLRQPSNHEVLVSFTNFILEHSQETYLQKPWQEAEEGKQEVTEELSNRFLDMIQELVTQARADKHWLGNYLSVGTRVSKPWDVFTPEILKTPDLNALGKTENLIFLPGYRKAYDWTIPTFYIGGNRYDAKGCQKKFLEDLCSQPNLTKSWTTIWAINSPERQILEKLVKDGWLQKKALFQTDTNVI